MRELERDVPARTHIGLEPGDALAIVGRGRMGRALAAAATKAGLRVRAAGRGEVAGLADGAGVVVLCVPDSEIAAACEELATAEQAPQAVGHVSGATGLEVLEPLAARASATFALHPLQTVTEASPGVDGAPCAIGGEGPGLDLARRLAKLLGMEPFELDESRRAAYHAAASIASNFLVTLEESASRLASSATGRDGRALLAPLVERTVANWSALGPAALTGPIARGDEQTVERHRAAISESAPELLELYEVLATRTRELASAGDDAEHSEGVEHGRRG